MLQNQEVCSVSFVKSKKVKNRDYLKTILFSIRFLMRQEIYFLVKIVTEITDSSEFSFTANFCNI